VEVEGPVLADEVVSEAVLGLLVDKDEPEVFVDPAGGHQVVGGPRGHAPVAGRAGEGEGLLDEPDAENHAAGSRSDEQDAQLGHARLVGGDQEHAAGAFTVDLGDPGRLLVRGVLGRVVADDLGHQRLEVGAEAELAGVQLAVRHHHQPRSPGGSAWRTTTCRCSASSGMRTLRKR
jgi:hypothetical protein